MEIRPILSALMRQRTGPLLVAIQVALSLAILANALFVVQQRIAVSSRPSGIADEASVGHVTVRYLTKRSHGEVLAQQKREVAIAATVPGVVSAAWTSQMPMNRSGSSGSVRGSLAQTRESAQASFFNAPPGFVKTLGLQVVEGRDFTEADVVENDPGTMGEDEGNPDGVIVSLALAQALFPGETSFAGRTFYFGMGKGLPARVLGVVERLQATNAAAGIAGEQSVILPVRISYPFSRIVVRAQPGQLDRVLADVADAIRKASPALVQTETRTALEDRRDRYRNEKAMAWMLVAVSVLLLLVTASGIVGMTSLRVAQRRKQIGVRRALGARWRDILGHFITENLLITTGGIVAGLLLALGMNRLMMSQLELPRLPLEYLAWGAGSLWLLGVLAVYGPASRAASISPAIATRTA